MRLQRLTITHLPGIREGFTLDGFGPGLNVVTGPNASGKSSLVRALRHLIDEADDPSGGALTLEAVLVSGEDALTVTRSGSHVGWQKDEQTVERPSLPRGHFLHCYWLSMDDLLEEGDTEQAFRDRLRRELSGGFDLEAVRQHRLFKTGKQLGQNQHKAFLDRDKDLRDQTQQYQARDYERQQLSELDEAISEARAASARATKVEGAIKWLEARRSRLGAEARLETFPPSMERLTGGEADRLKEHETNREKLEEERRKVELSLTKARSDLEETGLADNPPEEVDLNARRKDLKDAHDNDTRLEQLREQLDGARAQEETAARALQPVDDRTFQIEPDTVDRAVGMAEGLRNVERRIQDLEGAAEAEPPEPEKLVAHETLAAELRRWLRQLDPVRHRSLAGGGIAGVAFAVMSVVAAWLADAAVPALLFIGAIAAIG